MHAFAGGRRHWSTLQFKRQFCGVVSLENKLG